MNTTATRTRITLKNILYATDFSPAANAAIPYVLGLAKQFGGTVHAVHVRTSPYPIVGPEGLPQILEAEEEQAKLHAQQLEAMFAGVPHQVYVPTGEFCSTISDLVKEQSIDMIVLGTHGRTGIGRAFLGSAAEEIYRNAWCPVMTVGPHLSRDTERRLGMKEILFATDFSSASTNALPYAISLAEEHQARLTVLHVINEPTVGDLVDPERYVESTLRQLRRLIPSEVESWCEPQFQVARGQSAEKIMETAVALGADLIVMGVRTALNNPAVTTHLFRPTAHRVITHAECPVLTVRT